MLSAATNCPVCLTGVGSPCQECRSSLHGASDRVLASGMLVVAAYLHEGLARAMVHRLKYRADPTAAKVLGAAMAAKVPPWAEALVPVPRARLRRWRYGIDPALELARAISAETSLPVIAALVPPWWWPPHTRGSRAERRGPRFRARCSVPPGAILVDDVVTTGATLQAASAALGGAIGAAVVATTA
ncbi:MAG: hypothetical protein OEM94_07415 [Acidimicrobiia bacterium]|nr:hypothetical protein [Acidimicrobiia bacterium]